jgi:type IV secretory pathway protease TraF
LADAKQPSQTDVMRQIQQAFQAAQAQLAQLRESVTHTAELARLNSQGNYLQMEKEKAYRELGEAVWRAVQKGKLELPASLAPVIKSVEAAEQKAAAHASEITDILQDGEALAARLKGKNDGRAQTPLASRPKKK